MLPYDWILFIQHQLVLRLFTLSVSMTSIWFLLLVLIVMIIILSMFNSVVLFWHKKQVRLYCYAIDLWLIILGSWLEWMLWNLFFITWGAENTVNMRIDILFEAVHRSFNMGNNECTFHEWRKKPCFKKNKRYFCWRLSYQWKRGYPSIWFKSYWWFHLMIIYDIITVFIAVHLEVYNILVVLWGQFYLWPHTRSRGYTIISFTSTHFKHHSVENKRSNGLFMVLYRSNITGETDIYNLSFPFVAYNTSSRQREELG